MASYDSTAAIIHMLRCVRSIMKTCEARRSSRSCGVYMRRMYTSLIVICPLQTDVTITKSVVRERRILMRRDSDILLIIRHDLSALIFPLYFLFGVQ